MLLKLTSCWGMEVLYIYFFRKLVKLVRGFVTFCPLFLQKEYCVFSSWKICKVSKLCYISCRNLTSCSKMSTEVTVFERTDGLCLNEDFAVEEVVFTSSSARVVCPHLDHFRNEENILPVRWYKVKTACFVTES